MEPGQGSSEVGERRNGHRMPWGFWTRERIITALIWWHTRHDAWPAFAAWKPGAHPDYDAYLLPPSSGVQEHFGTWQAAKDAAAAQLDGRLV